MQNSKRRTTAAILIHDNATEAASRRSARWAALVAIAIVVWATLGGTGALMGVGVASLGLANSVAGWYRMRRYAAARFAKYRANPSTHI